jgi:hypothetical protein
MEKYKNTAQGYEKKLKTLTRVMKNTDQGYEIH